MRCEEGASEQHENGQARRARHEGVDEDGDDTARTALDGARSHYGRHIASKAHYEGDKRLAVQAYAVHYLIHDEGSPGHVAGIFHE